MAKIVSISGRCGDSLDQIIFQFADGSRFVHGGSGGHPMPEVRVPHMEDIGWVQQWESNSYLGIGLRFGISMGRTIEMRGTGRGGTLGRRFEVPLGHTLCGLKFNGPKLVGLMLIDYTQQHTQSQEAEIRRLQEVARKLKEDQARGEQQRKHEKIRERALHSLSQVTSLSQYLHCLQQFLVQARDEKLGLTKDSVVVLVNHSPAPFSLLSPLPGGDVFMFGSLELKGIVANEENEPGGAGYGGQQAVLGCYGGQVGGLYGGQNTVPYAAVPALQNEVCVVYRLGTVTVSSAESEAVVQHASVSSFLNTNRLVRRRRALEVELGFIVDTDSFRSLVPDLWAHVYELRTDPRDDYGVETYENQRWYPMKKWTDSLLPTDRYPWSSKDGERNLPRESFKFPPPELGNWRWANDWQVGDWEYAMNFSNTFGPMGKTSCVRRRLHRRILTKKATSA
eukprot:gb/GEZN01005807.1/.p1 GENE.gb/GEZN01005807.1/~~gb/GEZN01005807.1/.p1  ORF type:complete len:451 (+),score=43.22 gb/GEZN01005807.1/:55-1407(+)